MLPCAKMREGGPGRPMRRIEQVNYLTLTAENIAEEHICCAFSDRKCAASYQQKKQWPATRFEEYPDMLQPG
jgi:hypothetical protein